MSEYELVNGDVLVRIFILRMYMFELNVFVVVGRILKEFVKAFIGAVFLINKLLLVVLLMIKFDDEILR